MCAGLAPVGAGGHLRQVLGWCWQGRAEHGSPGFRSTPRELGQDARGLSFSLGRLFLSPQFCPYLNPIKNRSLSETLASLALKLLAGVVPYALRRLSRFLLIPPGVRNQVQPLAPRGGEGRGRGTAGGGLEAAWLTDCPVNWTQQDSCSQSVRSSCQGNGELVRSGRPRLAARSERTCRWDPGACWSLLAGRGGGSRGPSEFQGWRWTPGGGGCTWRRFEIRLRVQGLGLGSS